MISGDLWSFFPRRPKYFLYATSLGGTESLIDWWVSHASEFSDKNVFSVFLSLVKNISTMFERPYHQPTRLLSPRRHKYDEAISPLDVRLSVGLEDFDDLAADLQEALGSVATE